MKPAGGNRNLLGKYGFVFFCPPSREAACKTIFSFINVGRLTFTVVAFLKMADMSAAAA